MPGNRPLDPLLFPVCSSRMQPAGSAPGCGDGCGDPCCREVQRFLPPPCLLGAQLCCCCCSLAGVIRGPGGCAA